MSIPPLSRNLVVGRTLEETTAGLMNWLIGQGAEVGQPGPNRIVCSFGIKSVKTFKGLAWGNFSDLDKWPVKVSIDLSPSQTPIPTKPGQTPVRPKFCMKCGGSLPGEGNFCPGCGSPVPKTQTQTVPSALPGLGANVILTVQEDMPGMLGLKQMASGPFKAKYQQRLEAIAASLEQALSAL